MRIRTVQIVSLLIALLFAVAGCKQLGSFSQEGVQGASDAGAAGITSSTDVTFKFDFSSLLTNSINSAPAQAQPTGRLASGNRFVNFDSGSATYFTGTVTFESTSSGATSSFDITAGLDGSWDAILDHTLALQGGEYDVTVAFSNADQEYLGVTSAVTIAEDATNDISVTVHPVIGDTVITGSIVEQVPMFYFNYPPSDFDTTSDTYYMVVSVDGAGDTNFTFAQFTGGARLYLNLDGSHNIEMEVFKDATPDVVVARHNSTVNFQTGVGQTLNLKPIFGLSTFTLSEIGGDATFDIDFVDTAIDDINTETAGNYRIILKASGVYNTISDYVITEGDASLDGPDSGLYSSTLNFSNFQFDPTMDVELEIWDISLSEEIGNCAFTYSMTKNGSTESCGLTLNRRAEIGGRVLQVLGVNVVNADYSVAATGTRVFVDGSLAGTTGGASAPTTGYITLFLEPDATHDIYATTGAGDSTSDTTSYYAESWIIDNILLQLN